MPPAEHRGLAMRNRVAGLSVPDPTPVLFLIAAASALLYSMESMRWAALLLPGIILLPAIVYLLSNNLAIALGTLMASAAMPRFFLEVGTLKARPEHMITGLLCLGAVIIYKRNREPLRWIFPDVLVLAFVALNTYSSLFKSPAPSQTIKWSIQQSLVVVTYSFSSMIKTPSKRLPMPNSNSSRSLGGSFSRGVFQRMPVLAKKGCSRR